MLTITTNRFENDVLHADKPVLVMVFLGAYLAHLAGLEPMIGACLAGLAQTIM